MIIVAITGGLGNQLFQYAAGRAISIRTGLPLYIDLSLFSFDKHKFLLDKFQLHYKIASKQTVAKIVNPQLIKTLNSVPEKYQLTLASTISRFYPGFIYEKHYHFMPEISSRATPCYLFGYWQSEKYFQDVKDKILSELALKNILSDHSRKLFDDIKNHQSVSVNIRLGDYQKDKKIFSKHGLISKKYYLSAIEYIKKKIGKPYYYFFSDDISWVKKNLTVPYPHKFIEGNFPNRSEEDLILAANCRYNILTNSTFAWWAGYLNNYPEKITIAPKNWFRDKNLDIKDLFLPEWMTI